MNYFVTSLRARKFSLLPKLVTAAALFLPSLPFMTPGNASAAPILWTDTEIATSFNFGNSAYVASVSCTSDTFCVALPLNDAFEGSLTRAQSLLS